MSDWRFVREDVVFDYPEYRLALEEWRNGDQQMIFVALLVYYWSATMLKRFRREWAALRQHVTCPLYVWADVDDKKWERFVSLFGFKPFTVAIQDGKRRRIFWHTNDFIDTTTKQRPERQH